MKKLSGILLGCLFLVLVTTIWALAAGNTVRIIVDGQDLALVPPPIILENRIFLPVRVIAETLGADVTWNAANRKVFINTPRGKGERYLQGLPDQLRAQLDTKRNLINAVTLRDLLDDDHDGDLCDYREGHNGGDAIANDPLVVDVRARWFYDFSHIPGAVWIAEAAAMGTKENEQRLRELLTKHVTQGGKEEVVVYCHTGHAAGLVAGVLGTRGFNIKNLEHGFDIVWTGTITAPPPLKAPVEDKLTLGEGKPNCG